MSGLKICPHCEQEMDEDLAEEGICSECGDEFTEADLEDAREERRKARREERRETGEDVDDDEDADEEDS